MSARPGLAGCSDLSHQDERDDIVLHARNEHLVRRKRVIHVRVLKSPT
jgi:hypothetical protein